jgi:hypothetical protein
MKNNKNRIQNLYMSAWILHRKWLTEDPTARELKKVLNKAAYWFEVGAFVATLPRQSGKSTLLDKMFYSTPGSIKLSGVKDNSNLDWLLGKREQWSNTHLFIDEYDWIPADVLYKILDRDWASVTLIGSMKPNKGIKNDR